MFTLRLLKIKIHSRRVFMFKRCLPIFAFLLASTMLVWPAFVEEKEKFSVAVPSLNVKQGGGVDMEGVQFFSKDKRNNPLSVVAETVQEIDAAKKILKLNNPKAVYQTSDGMKLTSISPYALAFQNEKYLYFEDEINTSTDTGYEAISTKVVYDYDKNTISSDNDVFIKGVAGMLQAKGFFVTNKGEKIDFKGKTKTLLFEKEKEISAVAKLDFKNQDAYFKRNKNNILITSENGLIVDQALNTITAVQNAHIYQKSDHIRAEEITLTHKKDAYNKTVLTKVRAYKKAQAFEQNKTVQAEEMILFKEKADILEIVNPLKKYQFVKLPEQVNQLVYLNKDALVKENKQLILADKMFVFYKETAKKDQEIEKIIAVGNVKASNGVQRIHSDYGIYDPKTEMVDLYDNVSLHQGNSVLNGKWASMNLKTGISSLKSYERETQNRISGSLIPADFENESEDK